MRESLSEGDVDQNPFLQFGRWWNEALGAEIIEVNAMTLATANAAGKPSARVVLLKGYDEKGFVFFSNYQSRKGQEIEENAQATLLFFWKELERQVRIEGKIEKISTEESDEYFHSRPEGSRIGSAIPRPEHWGGYRVIPEAIEFWQGRPSRLHDRILYTAENQDWIIQRLAP